MRSEDKELEELLQKKALQTWQQIKVRQAQLQKARLEVESLEDPNYVLKKIREIVRGERAEEIISKAVSYYGDQAIEVFREIIRLYKQGQISELQDYELYQILLRLGMRVPLETRVRIVRHGEEKTFSEMLSE